MSSRIFTLRNETRLPWSWSRIGPLGRLAEAGPDLVLALGHELAERFRAPLVLQDLGAVQPVLDVPPVRDDASLVPLADRLHRLRRRGGDQVVERSQRPVAVAAGLRVGVPGVVEQLVLEPDRRALGLVELGVDVVLDPAVRPRRQPELQLQLECRVARLA